MGDENPISTLGEYSKPNHEGYRNTIELPIGNNVVPLRSDTIRLVQNGCSFHGLRSKDPNQHLKDFFILVDLLDLDDENKERTHLRTIDQSPDGKLRDRNAKQSWALLEDLALYDNESWNDLRDSAKPVKAIALPQDVPSTSDRCLIKLKNQVQLLMEAYLALTQPTQVNKITTSCEICSSPHDTQYCMDDPEQAFVEYAFSHTDEVGGKWYTFKLEENNLGDTYNPSWRSHPNLRFNNQSNLKGLVSNFMASQDARLSKFEADFKQQQSEMTNKIDTVLKAITDQIAGTLPSDTVKNPKLSISPVSSTRSYLNMDPQCSNHTHSSINTITIHFEQQSDSYDEKANENEEEEKSSPENIHVNPSTPPNPFVAFITKKVLKFNSFFESLGLVPQSSDTKVICTKGG
ncbi:hypothetical protein Tco_0065685 [Tanacetum coccineum]